MKRMGRWCAGVGVCVLLAADVAVSQERPGVSGVTHVLGLEGVQRNVKGTLLVDEHSLRFVSSQGKAEVSLAQVQDVFTGDDSQRVVGGTLQTLSMFAPYGGGRFLSLFRYKVDLLTVEYRDASGALHGIVFTLPDGKAVVVKKQMVEHGAKSSVPIEEDMKKEEKKEKKAEKKP